MAKRKKQEEAPAGSPAWMATFSDLMNLLLCFFVLLYSMSTIDADKYDAIRASLSNSINILQGGKNILNESNVINSGISQIESLNEYTNSSDSENDSDDNKQQSGLEVETLQEYLEQKKQDTSQMYDEISDMMEDKNLSYDKVNISIDPEYNFVKLTIDGAILFDSASASIKSVAKPILSKVGDILGVYDDYLIEIEGHTDNIPITISKEYPDNMWLSTARALHAANYLIEEKGLDPSTLKSSGRGEYNPVASNTTSEGRQKNRRVEIKIYNKLSSY